MSQPIHPCRPARYSVHAYRDNFSGLAFCSIYRNGQRLTQVRERDAATAVKEARRAVRIARLCGGAK